MRLIRTAETVLECIDLTTCIFSLPEQSPGRAIVLPLASTLALGLAATALAKCLTLKFFM